MFNGNFYRTKGSVKYVYNGKLELQLRYEGHDGKVHYKSFTASTLEACYERAVDFYYEYNSFLCRSRSTIPEVLKAKFESDLKLNFVKEQTYYCNLQETEIIERHIIGQTPIRDVTKDMIEIFLENITHYAPGTIEGLFIKLKQAFRVAYNEGIISKDLMQSQDIRRPKSIKPVKKVKALTVEEQELILHDFETRAPYFGTNDYRPQLLIQLYTGMRMGEVNALTPEDIDLEQNVIYVRNTIVCVNKVYKVGDATKTFAGYREIPISNLVKPVLEKALQNMKPNPYNLIFYDFKNEAPFSTNSASNYFSRACGRCGIEPRGSHALRHTFATRCIESGVPAVVLKKWLGHTDIHVTLDTYADVFDRMHHDAVDKLDTHLDELNKENK